MFNDNLAIAEPVRPKHNQLHMYFISCSRWPRFCTDCATPATSSQFMFSKRTFTSSVVPASLSYTHTRRVSLSLSVSLSVIVKL